jgi:uncharacterized protein (DUF58 family)
MARFADPKVLASLQGMPFVARTVVDSFMAGHNQSRQRGMGMEFSQYRSYEPGDDLRQLDWKMFARSDRYYIRQAEVDTSIYIRFVLDCSASMAHKEEGLSKFDYARYLVACLGYLAYRQGDAIGLDLLQADFRSQHLPGGHSTLHLQRFWKLLDDATPAGRVPGESMKHLTGEGQSRQLVVLLTDMYEHTNELSELVAQLGGVRHEMLVFHLLGPKERDFTWAPNSTLQDLETGEQIQVAGGGQKLDYAQVFNQWLEDLKQQLWQKEVYYEQWLIDQPLELAMQRFLERRKQGL